MNLNLNFIYKVVASVFVAIILLWGFSKFLGNSTGGKANESVVVQSLVNITKVISISQDSTGTYGRVTQKLPYTGCELPGSYLDNEEIKTIFAKLKKEDTTCVSDGNSRGEIISWAISYKVTEGKYWCVDESGNRKYITNPVSTSFCN